MKIRLASPAYCKSRGCPLLQAGARARIHGNEAAVGVVVCCCYCCCCGGGLWQHARTQNMSLWSGQGVGRGTQSSTRRLRRLCLVYSLALTAYTPGNATIHTLQRGYIATPAWRWAVYCGAGCPSVGAEKEVSLWFTRATSRCVSAAARSQPHVTSNRRRPPSKNLQEARILIWPYLGTISGNYSLRLVGPCNTILRYTEVCPAVEFN